MGRTGKIMKRNTAKAVMVRCVTGGLLLVCYL
jgi:hypothetical protein